MALRQTAKYWGGSSVAVVKKYFPDASYSDYEYQHYNITASGCVPDLNGQLYCETDRLGGALAGDAASPDLYFNPGNGLADRLDWTGQANGYNASNPFDALRWSIMKLRSIRIAGIVRDKAAAEAVVPVAGVTATNNGSSSGTPDPAAPSPAHDSLQDTKLGHVRPWLAYRSWGQGSKVRASVYYDEGVRHAGLHGIDDFLYWNPIDWMNEYSKHADADPHDDITFSSLLDELNALLPCREAGWLYPYDEREAPWTAPNGTIDFTRGFLLTGAQGAGEQAQGRVYRITVDPRACLASYATSTTRGDLDQDPEWAIPSMHAGTRKAPIRKNCTVVIPQGKIVPTASLQRGAPGIELPGGSVVGGGAPANCYGAWVMQPAIGAFGETVGLPQVQCTVV